jgi:hypothetical protein
MEAGHGMTSFLSWLMSPQDYMPHGMCFLWQPELIALHVASDSLIALAYYSIPIALVYFVLKRTDFRGRHRRRGGTVVAARVPQSELPRIVPIMNQSAVNRRNAANSTGNRAGNHSIRTPCPIPPTRFAANAHCMRISRSVGI